MAAAGAGVGAEGARWMPRLRWLWLRVHRWLALGLGWVLVLAGLTGATLVVARPLDRWLHPQLFQAWTPVTAAREEVPLQPLLQRLRAEFGDSAGFTFRPAREPGDTLWVLVRGPWQGTIYLDPGSGDEQGRRGDDESAVAVLFKLHSALLLGDTGKVLLAWVALAYLLLLVTGLVLWWPRRWPPSLKVALDKGATRALLDLHGSGGAVLGVLVMVSVATGAYMAWRPLGTVFNVFSGASPLKPPKVRPLAAPVAAPPLDAMVARARARFPRAGVGFVQVPAKADQPLRIRLLLADDPHPNGLTSVWLHPQSGEVLAAYRWNQLDPGGRANAVIYPLHTGELGGPALETAVALGGLALGGFGITGLWLWWRRRASRRTDGAP